MTSSTRQLHTIVSKDIVKPSSPTPSNLRTHNLSILDQLSADQYLPLVVFYPNSSNHQNPHDKVLELKKSLSYTLTKYYPFAGRMDKIGPSYVDCNDEGVEFIEAHNDNTLSEFLKNSEREDFDQLFANNLIWFNHRKSNTFENSSIISLLAVQVTCFACGGLAVATSLSHKVGDGSSIFHFVNHWATATRLLTKGDHNAIESRINPYFYRYEPRDVDVIKTMPMMPDGHDFVTKGFIFPNSKINELKAKIIATTAESGQPITNITRAEALTWLIYKCEMNAVKKTNSGVFKPSRVVLMVNMRRQFVEKLPETSIGNFSHQLIEIPIKKESEVTPNAVIGGIQEQKKGIQGMKSFETFFGVLAETYSEKAVLEVFDRSDKAFLFSFLNRFPSYGIDFGWGKPIKVTLAGSIKNVIFTYEAPNGDGIEANVCLEKEEMKIFENDPELLSFVKL